MQKIIKKYLEIWPYLIMLTAGILIGLAAANRQVWSFQMKLAALETALLGFHVLEEWLFPGGFYYGFNVIKKSDAPDKYPLNRLSDMFTNSVGIIFGIVCLIFGTPPACAVMLLLLCAMEVLAHTGGGIMSKKLLKSQGKKTIYNPGLFTALCGYLPIGVLFIVSFFTETRPSSTDICIAVPCFVAIGGVAILLPERLLKDKNTPYAFAGRGYYKKFTTDEIIK